MVTLRNHGGSCCGAKHLHSFSGQENANPDLINQQLSGVINGQAVEVILNGDQVTGYPNILERLANLGFVLDGHWRNGNHGDQGATQERGNAGSHCYRFTRMDRREAVAEGPIARRWGGMVFTPGLNGFLSQMSGTVAGNNGTAEKAHYTRPLPHGYVTLYNRGGGTGGAQAFGIGDTVRVSNPRSRRNGREFTVLRTTGHGYDLRYVAHDDQEGVDFSMVEGSFQLVERNGNRPEPFRPVVGQRVQYCGQHTYDGSYNNGEYATIRRVEWPYIYVAFDRFAGRETRLTANYLTLRDDDAATPLIPRFVAPPLPAAQVHADAQVLLERPQPREVEQVVPVTVLFRSYHNVYRDGRVGAGYDTFVDARTGRGAAGRIDRKEMLSDGTSRMVESVEE